MRKISVKAQKLFSLIFISIEQTLYNEILHVIKLRKFSIKWDLEHENMAPKSDGRQQRKSVYGPKELK